MAGSLPHPSRPRCLAQSPIPFGLSVGPAPLRAVPAPGQGLPLSVGAPAPLAHEDSLVHALSLPVHQAVATTRTNLAPTIQALLLGQEPPRILVARGGRLRAWVRDLMHRGDRASHEHHDDGREDQSEEPPPSATAPEPSIRTRRWSDPRIEPPPVTRPRLVEPVSILKSHGLSIDPLSRAHSRPIGGSWALTFTLSIMCHM